MPNRIIKESICVSEQIDELTPFEEITFYRLLVNCDDYGCFDARERVLLSRLFPLRDIKTAEIQKALKKLAHIGLIQLYHVGGKPFLNVCKWGEHQRLRVSKHKYPTPEDADDGEKLPQFAASCGEMPLESESESNTNLNTNTNRKPLKRFTPPTLDEVTEYCRERNNGINPQYFIDYYTTRGWKLKQGQDVKDWKACIRTWEQNERPNNVKRIPAQNFPQRDYKDVNEQIMSDLAAEVAEFNKGAG